MKHLILMSQSLGLLKSQDGKMGYILAWAIGIPIPVLLLIYFLRGCN